jgi:hypothetical protein
MFECLLERIALSCDSVRIPYMIVGGQAVLLYGEPRLTKDIDITLGVGLERLPDVLKLVHEVRLEALVDPEVFTRQTMVLPCSDPATGIRVDLIFSFSPYERLAISRSRTVRIGGADVRFASLEDLIIHKVIAGRPRDLEDAKSVLAKNPAADRIYIRHWLNEFASALGEDFLSRLDSINDV